MITPFKDPVLVTRPFLPDLEAYQSGLKEIWANRWLTNNGPILQRFTRALESRLNSPNVCLFNNGTLALQVGLQGLQITGEVVTTPFTFVATTHALYWNKVRPVFVDIDPDTYTISAERVEEAITPWTTAILAVHVFGHPCDLAGLQAVARKHNIKLIYDAAHAFGVEVGNRSIATYGDLSMFSFHATKPFHSIEGGMLVFPDPRHSRTFDYLKNFGFENETEVVMPGTNAKMNEFQALMGIQCLEQLDEVLARRRRIAEVYRERFSDIPGIRYAPVPRTDVLENFAYAPIEVLEDEFPITRDDLYAELKAYNVFARRYFYPLVTDFPCYRSVAPTGGLPVAQLVASRILTLPIYDDLPVDAAHKICDIIEHLGQRRGSRSN